MSVVYLPVSYLHIHATVSTPLRVMPLMMYVVDCLAVLILPGMAALGTILILGMCSFMVHMFWFSHISEHLEYVNILGDFSVCFLSAVAIIETQFSSHSHGLTIAALVVLAAERFGFTAMLLDRKYMNVLIKEFKDLTADESVVVFIQIDKKLASKTHNHNEPKQFKFYNYIGSSPIVRELGTIMSP